MNKEPIIKQLMDRYLDCMSRAWDGRTQPKYREEQLEWARKQYEALREAITAYGEEDRLKQERMDEAELKQ